MLDRPRTVTWQLLGMLMLIPGLLHVPLPQADFHVIRHHHGAGEVCPHHDHLLRWHPQAGESEDVAVLHWHWLFPQSLDVSLIDTNPTLHAHVSDILQPEWNGDQAVCSSQACVRAPGSVDPATWLDLALFDVGSLCAPWQPNLKVWAGHRGHDGSFYATSPAQLVRWNC